MEFSELILAVITAGGGGAVVSLVAFRFLAISWLENKFEERLESYRHENAKELQSLRANVDGALSRTVKAQEKEFEVLTECWALAGFAHGTTGEFVSRIKTYSDVGRLSDDGLIEYLEKFDFSNSEKSEIMDATDRTEKFIDRMFWLQRNLSHKNVVNFNNYLFSNQVFIEESVYVELKEVCSGLFGIIRDYQLSHEEDDRSMSTDAERRFRHEISPQLTALAPLIRSKFFDRV